MSHHLSSSSSLMENFLSPPWPLDLLLLSAVAFGAEAFLGGGRQHHTVLLLTEAVKEEARGRSAWNGAEPTEAAPAFRTRSCGPGKK